MEGLGDTNYHCYWNQLTGEEFECRDVLPSATVSVIPSPLAKQFCSWISSVWVWCWSGSSPCKQN